MRILVLGATGLTGTEVVRRALAAGHEVTALVRDPARMRVRDPAVTVAVGEVTRDRAAVTAAAEGCGAAVSALGSGHSLRSVLAPTVMSEAVPVIVRALPDAGVGRLVFLSSLGVGESWAVTPPSLKALYKPSLSRVFADKAAGERVLRASTLDWTLVCPPMLSNGPLTGRCTAGTDLRLRGVPRISRADVADFMVTEAAAGAHPRSTVVVASR
ncbi:Putative NADH-flavin reductase [Actinacidiphila rubida]|uniref:Putative NADH-flavin reductase n=2 Tax=Actinacidiphila rubida TaxID=310780 RepID=A0A1H8SNZ6_9ACTN|nr:NAD(P)H-binding protein [Actinacidiphila rubida]SEO80044.1 Putative NADH-flavin reductase [Actinacidiphila rubida]